MTSNLIPRRLYKYREFGINTLRLLSEAEVYYANPLSFNDPLDSRPEIEVDVPLSDLVKTCYRMLLERLATDEAKKKIYEFRYLSSEYGDYKTDKDAENHYVRSLVRCIKDSLNALYGKFGVFSLAKKWNCHLLWSHYADNHRGLCVEYDASDNACFDLRKVRYGTSRSVKISELFAWKVSGSKLAENSVFETIFLAKAPAWRYESEFRDIRAQHGVCSSPMTVKAVHFGMRCDTAVKTAVVKLYSNVDPSIDIFEVYASDNSFELKRRAVDIGEIEAFGVLVPDFVRQRDALKGFDDLTELAL
jgi:Protein of unknown function (DUF2971)